MYIGMDLGTSSIKTVLMDAEQTIQASSTYQFTVSRPHDQWSEQDPAQWIAGMKHTLGELRHSHGALMGAVRGIGLSGHMHGATLIDSSDTVLRPCILWNDTRSHAEASELDTKNTRDLAGNIVFPGFTAPKISWVANHEPDVFKRIAKVLQPKDYARLWLTGEYVSDMSDASGTAWLDVGKRAWSENLLAQTQLSEDQMPRLCEGCEVSASIRKEIASEFGLPDNVVVAGGAGDNAASACGMGTVAEGAAFVSLGTSGVLFAANSAYLPNAQSAVHTFCHALPNTWHQMGVILAATDALNWLSNITAKKPSELTGLLEGADASPTDVQFLPYLGGERTPHNDANARGVFAGLSHASDVAGLTQAVLQGVSFAFKDSQQALATAGTTLTRASAVGGGAQSTYWLQLLANILNIPLDVSTDSEVGASLGAARLAQIAADNADPLEICTPPKVGRTIEPNLAHADRFNEEFERYQDLYKRVRD